MSGRALPALPTVFEAYHAKVLAYATKLIGPADAEDVAQEVFIKVGRSLDSLEDPAKLTSWIYTITLNTVRDVARKRSSGREQSAPRPDPGRDGDGTEDALGQVADDRTASPEEDAMRGQMVACFLDYVEALPPNYYDVYVLSELEELRDNEIARRLSLTHGTVKIRLHRARAKLYEQLRRDCQCFCSERGELMGRPKDGVKVRPGRTTLRRRGSPKDGVS